jgi:hypothetical protein
MAMITIGTTSIQYTLFYLLIVRRHDEDAGVDMHDRQFGSTATRSDMLGHIPDWGGKRSGNRRRLVAVQTQYFI